MAKKKSNLDLTALMGQLNQDPDLTTYSETELGEVRTWIPTLIPEFDYNLVGGIPATGQVSEVAGPPSSGKGHTLDTPIPTPNGMTTIGDIQVGDYVFDRMGKPTKVLGVYPRGKMDVYRVTLADGRSVKVSEDHIWTTVTSKHTFYNKTTKQLIDEGVMEDERHYRNRIPTNEWVMYNSQPVSVDPYVMGAFLGDGCLTETRLGISSIDKFVVDKVSRKLEIPNTPVSRKGSYTWEFKMDRKDQNGKFKIHTSDIFGSIFNLPCDTYGKFIPEEYLYNSRSVRLELAQGLIDTDGHVAGNKGHVAQIEWTSMNETLTDQFAGLIRSLGYRVTKHHYIRKNRDNSEYMLVVTGSGDELRELVTLPRQLEVFDRSATNQRLYTTVSITNIEKLEDQEDIKCIYVDNKEHLYLVDDYIVTHNTTFAGSVIKNAIKMGFLIVYFDVESTQHSSRLQQLGVDPSKVLTMTPSRLKDGTVRPLSIESIGQKIIDILAEVHSQSPDTPVLFTWDSVAITQSDMQADADIDQQLVGQQAKALASIGRKIQSNLVMNNGTLLAFNQARDDFQAANPKYAQQKTTGGKGWEHLLSTRITFQQAGKIKVSASDNEAIGTHTRIKVPKSKVGDNFDSNFTVELIGAQGYDFEYNMVVEAQEQGFINKGNWPHYVTDDGEDIKEQNIYKLANRFKEPDLIEIKTELWQKILKHYFPECYPPLFNTTGFMHVKDFPIIKGLRKYYADIQEKLPLEQRAYNYNDFMSALANDDIPEDIVAEMNEPAPDPTPTDEGAE